MKITSAGFTPDKLGVPTNVFGSATIGSTNLPVPSPITHVERLRSAGRHARSARDRHVHRSERWRTSGPRACPANSRAGFGGGEGVYELGHEVIEEKFTLDFFLGDNRPGHTVLLIYLNGSTPVSIQLVFTAPVIHSPKPYGLGFSLNVPLIKVLPEASDASAKSSFLTLGAKNVAYYRTVHGKRKLFHVQGHRHAEELPPAAAGRSPRDFSFEDGSTVMGKSKIPCPKK